MSAVAELLKLLLPLLVQLLGHVLTRNQEARDEKLERLREFRTAVRARDRGAVLDALSDHRRLPDDGSQRDTE